MAIAGILKQSTAATIVLGPFLDDTDGKTAETALTIAQADVRLSKNAAAFAQVGESTSATHMENGYYSKLVNTTDTNTLGRLVVAVQEAGALPVRQDYVVVTADEFDRQFDIVGAVPALGILDRGTAQSATSTTLVLRSAATFADDTVIGATLMAFGATQGYWQTRSVTDYVLSTDTATVDAWTVTPSGTITYVLLAGAPASATDAATERNAIADAILNRDMSVGTDSGSTTVRTVRQALRALRNRFVVSAGTVTVYKEDDSTASFTAVVTGTPAVTQVNPAGGS